MLSVWLGRCRKYARGRRRTDWLAVLAILVVAVTTAAGWRGVRRPDTAVSGAGSASLALSAAGMPATPATGTPATGRAAIDPPAADPLAALRSAAIAAASSPVLSAAARRSCPPAATACADLSARLTWLQSDGTITYGPVRMEPGLPRTPRGTFYVQWKAGANYMSTEFHEPMPYAVFFAPGGIAFHGGSLTVPSHGCIHLDIGSARYYNDHLPVGAEVVVF
jgi:lipoprotein-anchoring transpeptidase ErfK/SrfK